MSNSILVTGGAGFIGSHLVRLFVTKYPQYKIVNLDKLTYAGNLENLKDIEEVLRVGNITRIMFDNFTPELIKQVVRLVDGKYETEASGGITLETVRAYAETGVDFISVGALTHSSISLDLSLKAF